MDQVLDTGRVVQGLEQRHAFGIQSLGATPHHSTKQIKLGTEVIVSERQFDPGFARDLAQRHAVVAAFGEPLLGRVEDALGGAGLGFGGG